MTQDLPYTPEILDLPRILDDMASGFIAVPQAHGDFGWSDEQRLALLQSVRRGLPIGAVFFWRTTLEMPAAPMVAGHSVGRPGAGAIRNYVLDGHQRLMTLFGALRASRQPPRAPAGDGRGSNPPRMPLVEAPSVSDGDAGPWSAWVDLTRDEIRVGLRHPSRLTMPLHLVSDGRALRGYQRTAYRDYDRVFGALDDPDFDRWLGHADAVGHAFNGYRVPVMVMKTDEPERVVDALQRLDTQTSKHSDGVEWAVRRARRRHDTEPRHHSIPRGLHQLTLFDPMSIGPEDRVQLEQAQHYLSLWHDSASQGDPQRLGPARRQQLLYQTERALARLMSVSLPREVQAWAWLQTAGLLRDQSAPAQLIRDALERAAVLAPHDKDVLRAFFEFDNAG